MLEFEFLMDVVAEVGDLVNMGPAPLGERRCVPILGGSFHGPRLRGTVMPGTDWQIARGDGALDIDARYALKETNGGIIAVSSQGLRHGPPEIMARLGRGETVDPSHYFFRTVMRFETGAQDLSWLNKTIAIASAARHARRVELRVWRLM